MPWCFARIDARVNGAAGTRPEASTSEERRFFELAEPALREVVDLTSMGPFCRVEVSAEPMARQGEGLIANITSTDAMRPLTRIPAYSAAKAGLANLTQLPGRAHGPGAFSAIRVNAIAPGFSDEQIASLTKVTGAVDAAGHLDS